jgi:hypothetical protein
MNRREFNLLAAAGLASAAVRPAHGLASLVASEGPMSRPPWPRAAYRRLLMDTHVPDWDPAFLESYDPVDYVRSAASAEFQCISQYANSHVGLCLWPTKIGQQHAALKGRDFFGETVRECRKRNLDVLAYYSLIFDIWAYDNHPDWRIVAEHGNKRGWNERPRCVCPNSPYAEHAQAVIRELIGAYAVDGIFFDMTFWPDVCYCPHCEARFQSEQGKPLPRIVDWNDPVWWKFQASRQAWMLEFAKKITQTVKETRPITVTHQCSTIFHDWRRGVSLEIRDASDYIGGDFYGGPSQYSLACKLFNTLSHVKPFEFHTSRTIGLGDFETTKPLHELTVSAFVATLHSAACLFIDAIKPDGEFDHSAYDLMGTINNLRRPYEPFLGGNLLADVAVYYDRDSLYDPTQNGVSPVDINPGMPHLTAMTGVASTLRQAHLPYGMVTDATLDQLVGYGVVILPEVLALTPERADVFRQFVREGGVLIATGRSSLNSRTEDRPRFLLEDVLGVKYLGMLGTSFSYLTPLREKERNLILPQDAISYAGPIVKAEPLPGTEVIAAATLPWVSPEAGAIEDGHFAQIWSNPPAAKAGSDPGITIRSYGKGKAIWIAAPIETVDNEVNGKILVSLLKDAFRCAYRFEADVHPAVEVTLFDQPQQGNLLLGLLNMESEDPPIPVPATVRVRAPEGKRIVSAVHLADKEQMEIKRFGEYASLTFQPFALLEMAQLKYE